MLWFVLTSFLATRGHVSKIDEALPTDPTDIDMPLSSSNLRRFVRHALMDASGTESPTHEQLAVAFDARSEQLRARLQPLFGAAAITALFARALHVATMEFPWLREVIAKDPNFRSVNGMPDSALQTGSFEEGLAALLAHQIGLLSTFVGDDLVLPLVQQAWGATPSAEPASSEDDQ
jgi:hypothetical protein